MVANAGIGILCKAIEMTLADWRRQTAVNLDGVFLSVKYAVPAMQATGGGSIIIMSSVAGLRGSGGLAGYCATKGGVRLFAKAVAMECAAAGDGIRVNTVHPGVIDTPIWTKISASAGRNVPIDPNEVAKAGVPLGRVGQAQDNNLDNQLQTVARNPSREQRRVGFRELLHPGKREPSRFETIPSAPLFRDCSGGRPCSLARSG